MFDKDAKQRIREYKKAIRGNKSNRRYSEHRVMCEMGWSYNELMNTPYEEYLITKRIVSLEKKEEAKEGQDVADEMESPT